MTLEQSTNTILHWVKSCETLDHLEMISVALQNCIVNVFKDEPVGKIWDAEDAITVAVRMKAIEIETLNKDKAEAREEEARDEYFENKK